MLEDGIVVTALVNVVYADELSHLSVGKFLGRNDDGGRPAVKDSLFVPDDSTLNIYGNGEFLYELGPEVEALRFNDQVPVAFGRKGDTGTVIFQFSTISRHLSVHRGQFSVQTQYERGVAIEAELEFFSFIVRNLGSNPLFIAHFHLEVLGPITFQDGTDDAPREHMILGGSDGPFIQVQGDVPVTVVGKSNVFTALRQGSAVRILVSLGKSAGKTQYIGIAGAHAELEHFAFEHRNFVGEPFQLVSYVLHRDHVTALDGAEERPVAGAVRPGFLAHLELTALVLGRDGDKGRAQSTDVLLGLYGEGDLTGFSGCGLKAEPVHGAAHKPVVGSREREGGCTIDGLDTNGVRLHRDGHDGRILRIEFLLLGLVAGSGSNQNRCGCSKYA